LSPLLDEDEGEWALWTSVLRRWDEGIRFVPPGQPLETEQFVRWLEALYQAIEPLRQGPRADWQLAAYALVDRFPLPML
jgi:hypothetical protein